MPKRRKTTDSDEAAKRQHQSQTCILHVAGIEDPGAFTALRSGRISPTEKLARLHAVREKRLKEKADCPKRMAHVCAKIPDSLDGLDLEQTGYHRLCYQRFTNHLTNVGNAQSNCSKNQRVVRTPSTKVLFPAECIICEKVTIRVKDTTQKCKTFSVFKVGSNWVAVWKSIEEKALELGDERLFRTVQGEDLFA